MTRECRTYVEVLKSKKLSAYTLVGMIALFFASCTATKPAVKTDTEEKITLLQQVTESPVFSKSFTGFALYDPEADQYLETYQADKYFTPASNTKIFTCFASLALLPDSIPGLRYVLSGDSLIFWGTGDPATLYHELSDNSNVMDFLKSRNEQLFYAPQWVGDAMGPGWAWDDYNAYYSAEKSAFPMYGNVATIKLRRNVNSATVQPVYFSVFLKENKHANRTYIQRRIEENVFDYSNKDRKNYTREIPYKVSNELIQQMLAAELGKPVKLYWQAAMLKKTATVQTIYSMKRDDMLARMMQASDNFVAEQLLLLCAEGKFGTFDSDELMNHVKDSLLAESPDKLVWRDGSGLSRYNLFTPRSIVYTLDLMRDNFGEQRLFSIFAVGGVSGTIKNWYKGEETPYVFAKTGTLSNKHCLSGYIKTKSGKTLIFSFMHNNYITGSTPLKKEMEVVLQRIREEY